MTRMMGLQGQKEYDGERGFIKEEVKCDMSIISCHVPSDNIGALNINIWYTTINARYFHMHCNY
jgi:hypothetical protein